jgi:putative ABC transport system permease protein
MTGLRHNNNISPPGIARPFLRWFLRDDLAEEVEGDLEEQYYTRIKDGSPVRAKLNYWYQVLNYLRPFAIRNLRSYYSNSNLSAMFRHNFIISLRNFSRYKTSFIINLTGLSTGLACAVLIFLWVRDEYAVDSFHRHSDRLYQILERQQHTGDIGVTGSTPWLLAESLTEEIPGVEYATVVTPFFWYDPFTLTEKDKSLKARGIYGGSDFFNVFSFELIHGDRNHVLADKNSIVISEEIARGLFGTVENAFGKTVKFQHEKEFKISGVFGEIPPGSSMRFQMVMSIDLLKDSQPNTFSWKNSGPYTFVLLKEGHDVGEFSENIEDYIVTKTEATHRQLISQRFDKRYLFGNYENGVQAGGRIEYVRLFSIIAVFILAIACINFMNLATARASRRMKEVGIKKVVGAYRRSLVFQYLTESVLMAFFGLALAIVLVYLVLPQFNQITGKGLSVHPDELILPLFGITLLTGLIAGSYPAFYLSGFKPLTVLKGNLRGTAGELWVRKGLVVFQFVLSVVFIVSVIVIYQQIRYVQTRNIGFNRENIIYFNIEGNIIRHRETFLHELRQLPGVIFASSAGQSPVGDGNTANIGWEGKDPDLILPVAYRPANYDLPEMMELEFLEGRSFLRTRNDSLKVIFNSAGIEAMGMDDPVGKTIVLGPFECEIIGVVENFNFESLHSEVGPMFFILEPGYTQKIMVRLKSGRIDETLARMGALYREFNPGFVFDYRFVNQDYQSQYNAEIRVGVLSRYSGGIAIIISCLGLLGLVIFASERRIKEIGIRKALGSSAFGIIRLLSADFTRLVLISILIALPVSYIFISNWLERFAFRIDLEWWYFTGAGVIALMIAWITMGFQTFKAARINPARCLQNE